VLSQLSTAAAVPSAVACPAGCCFLFGGLKFKTQAFNAVANQATSSLLFLSCIGIIIPTAAVQLASGDDVSSSDLLQISRGTAIIMLLV
jgi:Ca2+:H+ antiporter